MSHLSGVGLGYTPAEARREGRKAYLRRGDEIEAQRAAAEDAYRTRHGILHPDYESATTKLAARLGLTVEQLDALDEDELVFRIEEADETECVRDEEMFL